MKSRVLFFGRFAGTEKPTGPEYFSEELIRNLHPQTGRVISYFFDGSQYPLFTKLFGIRKNSLPVEHYTLGIIPIIILLLLFRPVIVHILSFERAAELFTYFNRLFSYKIIYTAHGCIKEEDSRKENVPAELKRKNFLAELSILRGSDKVVCVSEEIKQIIASRYSYVKEFVTIPNGISIPPTESRDTQKIKNVFVYGRNDIRRRAITQYLQNSSLPGNLQLTIVDDEDYSLNYLLSERVLFRPVMPQNELISFLNTQDIYLNLSDYETFSLMSLQAMSCGVITILTETTGLVALLNKQEQLPYVYNAGNYEALTVIFNELETMSTEQTDRVRDYYISQAVLFSSGATADKYLTVYREAAI